MKRFLLRMVCVCFMIAHVLNASAYDVIVNGIYYDLHLAEKTASVTYRNRSTASYSGEIDLPSAISIAGIQYSVTSIGFEAFSGCSGLTSLTIPEGVTSIGKRAFYNCRSLTTLTIPEGVTSIGDYAFYNCSGLTSVTIPDGVTSIGNSTFYSCNGLTSLSIPEGVTSIGPEAFSCCSGLTSVTIPEGVTSIGYNAFYFCRNLTSVTIPNSVTSIGSSAFAGCESLPKIDGILYADTYLVAAVDRNLSEIQWKEGTRFIGSGAFSTCYFLTSVTIPNSVTSIGSSAFSNCTRLTSVTIPNSVTDVGRDAFSGCVRLPVVDGIRYADTYLVEAVDKETISELSWKEGTRFIGSSAFSGCSNLTTVTIPNSVTQIGDFAFSGCSGLTSVVMPDGVTSIGYQSFADCSVLSTVIIPNTVTSIGNSAFYNCKGLTSVTISNSVTSIGIGVFQNCKGLTSVAIPNSVTSIGTQAFSSSGLTSVTIPNSVTSIGNEAFGYCKSLTSVTIPNSVKSIEELAFSGCSELTTVTISEGVTSIGFRAFYRCSSLTTVNIPNTVTSIGDNAFEDCTSLPIIDGIRYADTYLLEAVDKDNLSEIQWKEGTRIIRSGAFSNCCELTSVTIPNSVASIPGSAFSGCTGLTSVSIPNSVVIIGLSAFAGTSISSIYVDANIPYICGSTSFSDTDKSNGTLYVPIGYKTAYQTAEYWSEFQHIEEYSRLRMDDFRAHIGKTIEVPIYLENTEEMTSLEFDLYLPEGISVPYTTGRNGAINYTSSIIKGSDRFDEDSDHAISAKMTEDGALRVLLHSNTNMAFYDTDIENQDCRKTSPLLTLKLQISSDMEEGSQIIDLRNVIAASYTDGVTKKHELIDWATEIELLATRVVTVVSADTEKGSVSIEGESYNSETHEVPYGEAVTLTATPSTGYHFVHWIAGETVLSTENPYQLTVDDDQAIQAVFAVNQYSVRFVADGTAVYDELQDYGSAIALPEAPDKPGYAFYSWGEVDETVPAHNVEYVADYVLVGDVYTDATIDIADVTSLVGLVLNDVTPTGRELLQADVYADKQIDIADVTGAVGLVLNSSHSAAPRDMESFGTGVISLTAEEFMNIENGAHSLSIGLNNADCMVQALQFDVALPEGVELASANLHRNLHATDRLDHSLTASRLDEHTVRVMLYSLAANTIDGEEGEILSIDLQTTSSAVGSIIEVTNIKAVTTDGEPHELTSVEVVVGNVTGIGLLTVAQYVTIYDLEGRKVLSEYLSAGFDLKQRLGAGTYVVNGKKINIIY